MSTALYRRYRPETFAEMIGQQHVTEPLIAALRNGKIGHAYLFSGPRGCGKTTSARVLARCLNCAAGPTDTPCGVCPSCVELSRDGQGSIDVVEIDAASHGGVDDARELRERATYAPSRDRYKIFIIDEAHMVTSQGFNALLKIVEEPPEYLKFIFATTEPEKVLGTIRSRTHHYPFRLIAPATLIEYVEQLCAQEGVSVEPGVLPLLVRAGGGSARDTLSILDQLIAGSESSVLQLERASALLGFTSSELIDEVVAALAAGDGRALFASVDRVVQTGQDPRRFTEDLLIRLRDLIVVQATSVADAAAIFRGVGQDELERLFSQSQMFASGVLSRVADVVNAALNSMGGATAPRLQLELMMARALVQMRDNVGAAVPVPAAAAGSAGSAVPAAPSGVPSAVSGVSSAVPAAPSGVPSAVPAPAPKPEHPLVDAVAASEPGTSAAASATPPVSTPASVGVSAPEATQPATNTSQPPAASAVPAASAGSDLTVANALSGARALLQQQMDKIAAAPPSTAFLHEDNEPKTPQSAPPVAAAAKIAKPASAHTPAQNQAAGGGDAAAVAAQSADGAVSSPAVESSPAQILPDLVSLDAEELRALWEEILSELHTDNNALRAAQLATPVQLENNMLFLGFLKPEDVQLFKQHAAASVRELITAALGATVKFKPLLPSAPQTQTGAPPASASAEPSAPPASASVASEPSMPAAPTSAAPMSVQQHETGATGINPAVLSPAVTGFQMQGSAWDIQQAPPPQLPAQQPTTGTPQSQQPSTAQPQQVPAQNSDAATQTLPEVERVGESVVRQVFNPRLIGER